MDLNIDLLKELSLSEYEAKAYLVLLQRHHLSATEVSALSKVPKSRIYSILSLLEKKQYCTRVPGKERAYKAIDPKITIAREMKVLNKKKQRFKEISDFLSETFMINKQNDNFLDRIEVISDVGLISERYTQIEMDCKNQIKSILKPPFMLDRKKILSGEQFNINRDSINYVSIYDSSVLKMDLFPETLQLFKKKGLDVRICDNVPVKVMIFDNKTVSIQIQDKVSNELFSVIIIHHEDIVVAFDILFSIYYKNSLSLEDKLEEMGIKI